MSKYVKCSFAGPFRLIIPYLITITASRISTHTYLCTCPPMTPRYAFKYANTYTCIWMNRLLQCSVSAAKIVFHFVISHFDANWRFRRLSHFALRMSTLLVEILIAGWPYYRFGNAINQLNVLLVYLWSEGLRRCRIECANWERTLEFLWAKHNRSNGRNKQVNRCMRAWEKLYKLYKFTMN